MSNTATNQTPEQKARDRIDQHLIEAGWVVQDNKAIDFNEWVNNRAPLPFVYESTGVITRFTDDRDPKPRSREVFNFHRPDTLAEWLAKPASLRARLQCLPPLVYTGLRDCQISAIENLEASFKADKPRALVQMATGSGKTYTAITSVYRLLKYADAKRKSTELYNVQRLKSSFVARDSQVRISTTQRMYSLLKDEPQDPDDEPASMLLERIKAEKAANLRVIKKAKGSKSHEYNRS